MSGWRNRPYRGDDHRIPLQKEPGHPLGFIRTIEGKIGQLRKEADGLLDRLRYRYTDGIPHAYKNDVVFQPEVDQAFDLETAAGTRSVNYVVRDGQTMSVPIMMEGPGVFVARYFSVTFYQRLWGGDVAAAQSMREFWYQLPQGKTF